MMPIAVWYHTLFTRGSSPDLWPLAFEITLEAMETLRLSGLLDACQELHVGVNGIQSEAEEYALLALPPKAQIHWHGRYFNENGTICALHEWSKTHPGWAVLYFHCKGGASHERDSAYYKGVSEPWRRTMTRYLVGNWRQCVEDLAAVDVVCCHFMRGMADGTQNIVAGNFWFAQSSFLSTLPSMYERERIKVSGIAASESRYEAEVWIGNGKMPTVREYLPRGGEGVP